jgi:periplasmic protein TonB
MPTLIETPEPEVLDQKKAADTCTCEAAIGWDPAAPAAPSAHLLFSDSLLDSSLSERRRRSLATTLSIVLQCMVIGVLLILPLMFTQALPTQQLLTYLVAPPPPPPPPPPPAAPLARVVQTDMLNTGQLRTPTRIPQKVEMIREEEAPPPATAGGVVGGVPGGIPGGQLSGVIGGIISSASNSVVVVPKVEPVKRVRISQGVTRGMVISKIEPKYPSIAVTARITGVVLLKAIISKEGRITELQVVSGHPVLIPAALDAVKQWRYRPYLLNGEPVEVETTIMVNFDIAS